MHVRLVERRPLASLGLHRPQRRDWLAALLVAAVTVIALAGVYLLLFPALGVDAGPSIDALQRAPAWWLWASVVRAGASEEVLFRAYPITRLREWTGSRVVAVGVPLLLFALAHVGPWGLSHLLVAGVGGALLTWRWLWRANLWVSVFAHILVDAVGVLAG